MLLTFVHFSLYFDTQCTLFVVAVSSFEENSVNIECVLLLLIAVRTVNIKYFYTFT